MNIKRFDDFINESYLKGARVPLSHSTSPYNAKEILDSNRLNANNSVGDSEIRPISFSRNPNYIYLDLPVTLIFDYEKLRNNYKIVPFDWNVKIGSKDSKSFREVSGKYYPDSYEFEETIHKDVKNVDRYLLEIRLNKGIERFKNAKLNTRQELRESYDDLINSILEYKEKNPHCLFKVFYKGKEVDESWLVSQLPIEAESKVQENVYNKMSGTRIYVTKAADQKSYRVYYSSYKPKAAESPDEFLNFLNQKGIKHSKAGKSTLNMDNDNVEKMRRSMLNLQ